MTDRAAPHSNFDPGGGDATGAPGVAAILLAASLAAPLLVAPAPVSAADYRIRTYSLGRATQTYRSDRTANARRIFTQGLDLRAYNLLGASGSRLSAVVDARYTTDFTIARNRRDDPLYTDRWNDVALRLAYLDWTATRGVELRFGRQWSRGTLGIRDFDGLHVDLRPRLDASTTGLLALYGGRDIELYSGPLNTDNFDVQGLPASNEDDASPVAPRPGSKPWLAGGRLGLEWGRGGSVSFSYRRRWHAEPGAFAVGPESRTGSERVGVAAAAVPQDRVNVSASAVYHTLLESVDRAAFDVAWDIPEPLGTVSTGVEHRRPWFDSSSIFNLFGTRPHQGAHAVYQHPFPSLQTELQFRHWGRIYRGDPRSTGLSRSRRKTTRLGGAVAHYSELFPFGHLVDWNSQVSVESDTRGEESTHLLADTHLKTPVVWEGFYVTGRLLFLAATASERPASSARSGAATTYVLGVDIPVREIGTLSILAERTVGSFHPPTTNLFGSLELEIWR